MKKYSEKLKNPKWQKRRLEVLSRDNFTCCKCGDTETELQVHHLKYTGKPHEAPLNDLETLCKYCHEFISKYEKLIESHYKFGNVISVHRSFNTLMIEYNNHVVVFIITSDENLQKLFSTEKRNEVITKLYELSNKPTNE